MIVWDILLTHSPMVLLRIISSKHPFKASRNGFKEKQRMKKQPIKKLMKVWERDRNMVFEPSCRPPPLSLVRQRLLSRRLQPRTQSLHFPRSQLGPLPERSKTSIFLILYQMPAVEAKSWATGLETVCLNTSFLWKATKITLELWKYTCFFFFSCWFSPKGDWCILTMEFTSIKGSASQLTWTRACSHVWKI